MAGLGNSYFCDRTQHHILKKIQLHGKIMYIVHLISHCAYLIKVIVFEKPHIVNHLFCTVVTYGHILVISTIWQIWEIAMTNPNFPESVAIFEWVYVPVSQKDLLFS